MHKVLLSMAITGLLVGCASHQVEPLPESGYQYFAETEAKVHACYLKEYYDVEFTQKALAAIQYNLHQWAYDSLRYSQVKMRETEQLADQPALTNKQACRELELAAQSMIVKVQEHKAAVLRQQQIYRENEIMMHQWQMMNRPTTCYTQGNMVRCF